jgi:(p)ppGpp synthase/HD superfamily hydrolase
MDTAQLVAFVAHTARGQKRADGVTPYITHPRRVGELALDFGHRGLANTILNNRVLIDAALLHDVLEDTKLTRDDLLEIGVERDTLDVVERLTKKNGNEPATPDYYQGISESLEALVVKCADRCANLEDALAEVKATRGLKRWRRYVEKTTTDVLPMYVTLPRLRAEIETRLALITDALPVPQDPEPEGDGTT